MPIYLGGEGGSGTKQPPASSSPLCHSIHEQDHSWTTSHDLSKLRVSGWIIHGLFGGFPLRVITTDFIFLAALYLSSISSGFGGSDGGQKREMLGTAGGVGRMVREMRPSPSTCEGSSRLGNLITTSAVFKVLFGLEYAHAIPDIREELARNASSLSLVDSEVVNGCLTEETSQNYSMGGLSWRLPKGRNMEEYLLFWIGMDNPAFANLALTVNSCEIVRYDATEDSLMTDVSQQTKILKRRYYLVQKAKDANMVGILVGTLGVAGYLHIIHQMRELVTKAGKKSYTFVMGRPNPAKLANFPECDVFINVSCAQTALLDSKEFFAPVITPFEAMLAFERRQGEDMNLEEDQAFRGSQWTGAYVLEFPELISSTPSVVREESEEARFSFLQGGYVEDLDLRDNEEVEKDGMSALVNATEKALQVRDEDSQSLTKSIPKSGAEYLARRSYQGLDIKESNSLPQKFLSGRSGKASGYKHEKRNGN
ncbi:hypothetical protein BUALT_Bualt19G0056500 [Buddleja alternifolia]|uniref:2-(3-amino-3-carboxypropyl)histidine synthase subunit 2 n=1 Tax=Buddleja alternifolia TaxID=168488 RepID=A0AAV6W7D9_9LAMI|nr:hypothetical protein BUALT_Bualt19G0056500 [Buddleja alternifolia]